MHPVSNEWVPAVGRSLSALLTWTRPCFRVGDGVYARGRGRPHGRWNVAIAYADDRFHRHDATRDVCQSPVLWIAMNGGDGGDDDGARSGLCCDLELDADVLIDLLSRAASGFLLPGIFRNPLMSWGWTWWCLRRGWRKVTNTGRMTFGLELHLNPRKKSSFYRFSLRSLSASLIVLLLDFAVLLYFQQLLYFNRFTMATSPVSVVCVGMAGIYIYPTSIALPQLI